MAGEYDIVLVFDASVWRAIPNEIFFTLFRGFARLLNWNSKGTRKFLKRNSVSLLRSFVVLELLIRVRGFYENEKWQQQPPQNSTIMIIDHWHNDHLLVRTTTISRDLLPPRCRTRTHCPYWHNLQRNERLPRSREAFLMTRLDCSVVVTATSGARHYVQQVCFIMRIVVACPSSLGSE
jgi:hypothetical protein